MSTLISCVWYDTARAQKECNSLLPLHILCHLKSLLQWGNPSQQLSLHSATLSIFPLWGIKERMRSATVRKNHKAQEEMMQSHSFTTFHQQIDAQALSEPMATLKNTFSLPVLLLGIFCVAWIISLVSCPDCVPSKPLSLYTVYLLGAAEWKKGLDAVQALFSSS